MYRAIKRLEELNLIEIKGRQSKTGRTTTSVYTLKLNRLGESHGETSESHGETLQSHGETLILESSSESSSESKKPPKSAAHSMTELLESNMKAEDLFIEMTKGMTEEQVIQKAKAKGKPSSLRLSQLWKDLHVVHNVEVYVGPASPKEQGQFTQLAKLMDGTDVCRVMSTVVRDWVPFGKFLKEQGVVQDFPDHPHAGFLLKHGVLAAQFHHRDALKEPVFQGGGLKPYVPECN